MRKTSTWITMGLVAILLMGCAASNPNPVSVRCDGFESDVLAFQTETLVEDLGLTLLVFEKTLDAADAERVVAETDAFTESYVQRRTEACEAKSKVAEDCFVKAFDDFRTRIDTFKQGDHGALSGVGESLDACLD